MSNIYLINQVEEGKYSIANFGPYKEPEGVYYVRRSSKGYYSCDCRGYRVQDDKTKHKHCRLVKFWLENLEGQEGFALWFDGDDMEYRRFVEAA